MSVPSFPPTRAKHHGEPPIVQPLVHPSHQRAVRAFTPLGPVTTRMWICIVRLRVKEHLFLGGRSLRLSHVMNLGSAETLRRARSGWTPGRASWSNGHKGIP